MLDQRGQFLRVAVGFATLSMNSYDGSLQALRTRMDSCDPSLTRKEYSR